MKKKPLILFLALVLPVAIYFFLKLFGNNRFDLPVIHEVDTEWPDTCPPPPTFPFRVSNSLLSSQEKPFLVIFGTPGKESLLRLPMEIDSGKVWIRRVDATTAEGYPCLFGAPPDAGATLIDMNNRVRGIYKILERDEADRLIMEVKILTGDY